MDLLKAHESAKYLFLVKEYPGGGFWISMDPCGKELGIFKNGFLGFSLPEETTWEKVVAVARFLNENIELLTYTDTSRSPRKLPRQVDHS